MAYDIKINKNGSIDLTSGDITPATYHEYVGQLIYSASMQLALELSTGKRIGDLSIAIEELRRKLISYLYSYGSIEPNNIEVFVEDASVGSASLRVRYRGYSPEGLTMIDYTSPLDITIEGGAYKSVELRPPYLTTATLSEAVPVKFHVSIDEQTKSVRIPGLPTCAVLGSETPPEEYVFLTNGSDISFNETTVSINLYGNVRTYVLSRFVDGIIMSATITSGPTTAAIVTINGETALFYSGSESSSATAMVTTASAIQASRTITVPKDVGDGVFPLSPLHSPVTVEFERTIAPGRYVIQYNELREVRSGTGNV